MSTIVDKMGSQHRYFLSKYISKIISLTVIIFTSSFLIFFLFQLTSLVYSLNATKSVFHWGAISKYFVDESIYLFFLVFPVCFFIAVVFITLDFHKKNYFLRYELAGVNIKFVLLKLFLIFYIMNLFFALINETVGKNFKKNAEIIYDDEIIVNLHLNQRYFLINSKSINPDEKISIIFEYLSMDNSYSDTINLTSVFLLQKNENRNQFIWSNVGRLYNDHLELTNPVYQIDIKKIPGKAPQWTRSVLESNGEYGLKINTNKQTLKAEDSKMENVSIFALDLNDLFHMYYWADKIAAPEKTLILSIIVFTLFFYLILPVFLMGIALNITKGTSIN
jgi:hypothetical protein